MNNLKGIGIIVGLFVLAIILFEIDILNINDKGGFWPVLYVLPSFAVIAYMIYRYEKKG